MFGHKRREIEEKREIEEMVDAILSEAVSVYDNSIDIADRKAMFLADKCNKMKIVGQPNTFRVKSKIYDSFERLVSVICENPRAKHFVDKKTLMAFRNALLDDRLGDGGYLANEAYRTIYLIS